MPELPEVETIARSLRDLIRGAEVRAVTVDGHAHWRQASTLKGRRIEGVRRLGKHLLLDCSGNRTLDVHFGMTGAIQVASVGVDTVAHERMRLGLILDEEQLVLRLVDPRGFGHARVGRRGMDGIVDLQALHDLGPDALDAWSFGDLEREASRRRSGSIKALLLDQHAVAGIGNYIADEALHAARVRPQRPASGLSRLALLRVHGAVIEIIERSLAAGGASLRDYEHVDGGRGSMQTMLRAYGRAGEPCMGCGAPLVRAVVAGRGTTYCPRCQR